MKRLEAIKQLLEDKKGENVEIIDLSATDYFVDYVIIATSLNDRHGLSLLDYLKKEFKGTEQFLNVDEGEEWIAIDLGDMLVHIMVESIRDRYNIEQLLDSIKRNQN
jgi:ribosome-associated protein